MTPLVVLTTVGHDFPVEPYAEELVERRLAACVNIIEHIRSIYRWENRIERENEILLVIKTTDERLAELREHVFSTHPYDVPEFVVIGVAIEGPYLAWLAGNTAADLPR